VGGVTETVESSGGTAGRETTAVAGGALALASEAATVEVGGGVDEVWDGGETSVGSNGIPVVRGAGNTQGAEQCWSTSYVE